MKKFYFSRILSLVLLFLFLSGVKPLSAEGSDTDSEWMFTATPYVWASGMHGTVGVKGHKARVDLSFSDILGTMDAGAMLAFQGHKGKQYFFFDGMYLDTSDTDAVSSSLFADVNVTTTRLQAAWGRRVMERGASTLDLFVGLRYWNVKNALTLKKASIPVGHYSDSESWLDPLVGINYVTQLSPNLSFGLLLDAGGFGIGSRFTWGGIVDLTWRLSEHASLEVGYRYLTLDYENKGFVMDTYNDGIFIGFTWKLK